MATASYATAFSLSPTLTLTIGGREHTVPPLTFGRFQSLIGAVKGAPELTAEGWWPIFREVIPGVTWTLWKAEIQGPQDIGRIGAEVLRFMLDAHDWDFIWSALGWGKKPSEDERVNESEFLAAASAVARANGMTLPQILELKVEGYFVLVMALKAQIAKAEEKKQEGGGFDVGMLLKKEAAPKPEGGEQTNLQRLMAAAKAAAGVQ